MLQQTKRIHAFHELSGISITAIIKMRKKSPETSKTSGHKTVVSKKAENSWKI